MRKSYRVKKEKDFQNIFNKHNSVANKMFILYFIEKDDNKHFRLGISVPKKIALRGHERVWIKRRIRQSILELNEKIKSNTDILIIARPNAYEADMKKIKKNIEHILILSKLI